MSARPFLLAMFLSFVASNPSAVHGTTWYVDGSVSASGDGKAWATALKTIQEGIDAASNGDTVIVGRGTYVENIKFKGRNIILRSTDPLDADVVANTIVDGNQTGSVVTFAGTENKTCVLSGFTIRNGKGQYVGGICGGSPDQHTYATIQLNVITENSSRYGGGVKFCNGLIENNTINGSAAEYGGGGLADCNGTIRKNIISGNVVTREGGGGLFRCGVTIESNTVVGNSGAGLSNCAGTIRNCIVWGNWEGGQLYSCSVPTYSCIEGWTGGGEGNIDYFPYFVDTAQGDYHLKSWSPCIDAGDPASDFSQEPQPNGGRIDMGAYGNTPEATSKSPDTDGDGLPDDWEIHWFGGLEEDGTADPDGDSIPNITEYLYGRNPTSAAEGRVNNETKNAWYISIEAALSDSDSGDEIVVYPGVYMENINFGGKNVVLSSSDPSDADIVASTIIDGNQTGSVVTFDATENKTCVLSGFTIRNGKAENGGGICGGSQEYRSYATIQHNVIIGNSLTVYGYNGGGVAFCNGLIQNNTICGNTSSSGGGLAICDGTIRGNTIFGNSAGAGGGLFGCYGTIENNTVSANSAKGCGGGLYDCKGTIQNNVISGNLAGKEGGGLSNCRGPIINNTIVGNSADEGGGGLDYSGSTIRNCIIWGNQGVSQLGNCCQPWYCCIEGWTDRGEGNIDYFPYFVSPAKGNYHLKSWSPCIDAGDPASDFSQEPQPNGGRIDMGAYGNTPEATSKSPDTDGDGLPDDWEISHFGKLDQNANDDADSDLIPNLAEYLWNSDPRVAPSSWYVDCSVPNSGDGTTWGTAFKTIQEGINGAPDGGSVVVKQGIYFENITFNGKNIVLRSTDPLDQAVVESTIIDGSQKDTVVKFNGSENGTCVLSGFTIRNGKAESGGGICGGTDYHHTHATIRDCLLSGNSAEYHGGGLWYCDGTIQNNTISGNSVGQEGGGLSWCNGKIQDNTITGNTAVTGGGLSSCQGEIINNTVSNNAAGVGGGLANCNGVICNNIILGNSASENGGGLLACQGTVQNNTIAGNSAAKSGGGLASCKGIIRNCIVWGNWEGGQLYSCSVPTYSCIEGWTGGGEGNIDYFPYFVDTAQGDYHLKSWSPCIDAGDPASDFSQEPEPNGERVDMGAYGNTSEATSKSRDTDNDGLPDDWEMKYFGDLMQGPEGDTDGDRISNIREYHEGLNPATFSQWHVDGSVPRPGDGSSWETAFRTIQKGIDAASDYGTVIVAQGTYLENIKLNGKNVILRSTDPTNPTVIANTIIDGKQAGAAVTFSGIETEACALTGFTIRNGSAGEGGGICGGTWETRTHTTIENNTITGNFAGSGGGLYACNGTIQDNTITGNSAGAWGGGGGLSGCGGTIQNNTISANSADFGGGLDSCGGTIQNNTITGNSAEQGGGGLAGCEGVIRNNLIKENSAGSWGGGLWGCDGTIQNNLITHNSADSGGGLHLCDGTIENNTVVGNSAFESGGGLASCEGIIRNCIVWGNWEGGQLYSCSVPTYSCIEGWTGGGEGNIDYFPYFVDTAQGDYHLKSWSPCIDAGDPASDFSQEPEPNGERVDMGAYGNTSEATSKSRDTDNDGLPDDWEMKFFGDLAQGAGDDVDDDQVTNILEYQKGLDPTATPSSWYVKASASVSGDGTSWETAFKTIQEAIDSASHGDTITVASGTYVENVHFKGKNVVVRSIDPSDPMTVADTIIDGNQHDSVVAFGGIEDENCVLAGFTIRNGRGWIGGGIRGGTQESHAHATIENNTITGCSAEWRGGGLAFCDGTIQKNTITGNSTAGYGDGGGLYGCNGTILNNTVSGNSVGTPGKGGGLAGCDGTILNNTVLGNSGGGLYRCEGTIKNCIVWGNWEGGQLSSCSMPTYSCIEGWTGGGEGNIDYFPYFVDTAQGDYHLKSWSPCIDAGDPASDFSQEPEPNGGRIDMGAYGNTPEATSKSPDTDGDGLPDDWEIHWFGGLEEDGTADPDGDSIPNITEYLYGRNPTSAAEGRVNNETKNAWYISIQAALSDSDSGDEIVVYPGVYMENINFGGKNVVLRSSDPSDADIMASTIIDGRQSGSVVTFSGTENESCVLSGFTILSGSSTSGGGICGGTADNHTRATIQRNTIVENLAWHGGGGLYGCDGIIQNNTITGNTAGWRGGGLASCNGIIRNNAVRQNTAGESGGGFDSCDGTIRKNTISQNSVTGRGGSGGGLDSCDGTIEDNAISRNEVTGEGANGGGLASCGGTVRNNTFTENSATHAGGALFGCNGIIQNNTIVGNTAGLHGCGFYRCEGAIKNCTVWGNGGGAQLSYCSVPSYSCVEGWTGGGEENTAEDPRFMDAENWDFRLLPDSPCIDAGFNDPDLPQMDIAGMHRIMFGGKSLTVDMGAYEFYVNDLTPGPNPGQTTFTWSSLADRTYSIFYTDDLLTWHLADGAALSGGDMTTSWIDDGSKTTMPPSVVPRRFYRVLEN